MKKRETLLRKQKFQKDYEKAIQQIGVPELEKQQEPILRRFIEKMTSPLVFTALAGTMKKGEDWRHRFLSFANQQIAKVPKDKLSETQRREILQIRSELLEAIAVHASDIEGLHVYTSSEAREYGRDLDVVNASINALQAAGLPIRRLTPDRTSVFIESDEEISTDLGYLQALQNENRKLSEKLDEGRYKRRKRTDLVQWHGDQPVRYDLDRSIPELYIGVNKIQYPLQPDATKRQILMTLLVNDYNQKDGVGIDTFMFRSVLAKCDVPVGSLRLLETAVRGINKDIEKAFGISNFVRMKELRATLHVK